VTVPEPGRSRPATKRSSVDFPDPFTPIRPVRPGEKAAFSPESTGVPSGQEKERSAMTIAEGMSSSSMKRSGAHATTGAALG
jgi:hypothetical protein